MSGALDGRVALVTGAGGGLGSACAVALAEAGASLVLVGRRLGPLRDVARRTGGRAEVCDVTDGAGLRALIGALPPVDVLVTCAGGNRPQPFLDVDERGLEWSWSLNVRGAFVAAQAVAARMLERGVHGSIVFVTSQMGHIGAPARTVYCMAKHALEGLTKALALELAPHGIRVNAVAPTFVETPMTAPFLAAPDARDAIVRRIPLGRLGTPREVAQAVAFAASPAASLMTGTSLLVDGGWTAQ
ncbi:MAG TPA: SDR family oxidoreductase [Solirubrobacter sp.]|nr:SDR family oxidoreductase [Solirubrobacter sp.]